MAERLNTKKGNVKALTIFSANVMHWKVHFRETVPILVDAYQNGVETGDFEFAAIRQIRRENPSNWIAVLWQTVLNLLGKSENPSRLIGRVYEEQARSQAIAVKDKAEIHYFYLNKVILCYLFGEYHQSAQTAVLQRQSSEEVTEPVFDFYESLVLLSLLVEASNSEKAAPLNRVNTNQEKLQKWA